MSRADRRVHHTYAQYVALEDESPIHHEYLDGEIYSDGLEDATGSA